MVEQVSRFVEGNHNTDGTEKNIKSVMQKRF
jgi:hypothetical protein